MKPAVSIYSDVRRTPSPWLFQGLIVGAVLALVCPALSVAVGWDPIWLPGAAAGWSVAHLSAITGDTGVISGVLATQAAFLFAAPLIWRWIGPRVPRPNWLDERIVDARAIGAFQARKLNPEGHDVLIYVDLPLRRARIVAGVDAARALKPARIEQATETVTKGAGGDIDAAVQQAVAQLLRTR